MMRSNVECIEMTEEELERLLEHTRQRTFSDEDEDVAQIEAIVGSYHSLWQMVASPELPSRTTSSKEP